MNVRELCESIKAAFGVAGATMGTGLGTVLDWIPDDIGKLGVLIGAVLSSVLIWNHLRLGRLKYEKAKLENEKLRLEVMALEDKETGHHG